MSDLERIVSSVWRMPAAILAALLAAWTAVVLALWTAIFGAIFAVLFLILHEINNTIALVIFSVHTAGGLTFLTVFATMAAGAVGGFAAAYSGTFVGHEVEVASSVLLGAAIALLISYIALTWEHRILRLRGYRAPSRREWEQKIMPGMTDILSGMGVEQSPLVLISDTPVPQAWTHANTIVVTKGLLDGLDQPELNAVLAHEVCHWRMGDGIAMRMVWAMCWPLAILYNAGMFLSGARFGPEATMQGGREALRTAGTTFVAALGWLFLWPTALLIRFVIAPIADADCRRLEYEADTGVAALGMGDALIRALESLPPFEMGRTAFEAALTRTHPPIEHRIDWLERLGESAELPPVPAAPTKQNARWVLAAAGALFVIAISPLWSGLGTNGGQGGGGQAAPAAQAPPLSAPSSTATTPEEVTHHVANPTSGAPDTSAGAVDAAASFATAFYDHVFNRAQYVAVIDSAAAPGDLPVLVASADAHFAAAARAVGHNAITNTATVLADKVVSASPTKAVMDVWVTLHYALNGGTPNNIWATAPYALVWRGGEGGWRIASIPPASTGPAPAELHGASVPTGFSAFRAPPPFG